MKTILGKKMGMTQIFTEHGAVVPVTVVEAGPMTVTQIKTVETDGYDAVQFGFEDAKPQRVNKPMTGHFEKGGVAPKKHLAEFRPEEGDKRLAGALAAGTYPSRVFKGNAGPGRMGRETVTVQNVELVKVIEEKNLMLIKGAVPGNKGGLVRIQYAVKGQDK